MFWICLPIVLLCFYGFCRFESLWGILIKAFSLFFATLFAVTLFQPVANLFDRMIPAMAYYNDMWAFLIIFGIVLGIEITVTNFISRINLFFPRKVNSVGNNVLLAITFIVFYFTTAIFFFYLIPEAPVRSELNGFVPLPQFTMMERMSNGFLKPISGGKTMDFAEDIYFKELTKNAAVYTKVFASGAKSGGGGGKGASWTYPDKVSPNIRKPDPKDDAGPREKKRSSHHQDQGNQDQGNQENGEN